MNQPEPMIPPTPHDPSPASSKFAVQCDDCGRMLGHNNDLVRLEDPTRHSPLVPRFPDLLTAQLACTAAGWVIDGGTGALCPVCKV